jgi:hypothetical protein
MPMPRDVEREYRLTAPATERDTIFSLGRHRKISDETARKLVWEIDMVEARYREVQIPYTTWRTLARIYLFLRPFVL